MRLEGPYRFRRIAAGLAACVVGLAAAPHRDPGVTPPDFKVAFFGDSSFNKRTRAVFALVRDEGPQLVVHLGDFDYHDDPLRWEALIDEFLGPDFPFLAVVGNHDVGKWPDYQLRLRQRAERAGIECSGDLGVRSSCTYGGLFLVLSGAGTKGEDHEAFIRERLGATDATWRICVWHKNQHTMQIADKIDEVGWGPYEACREGGAFIVSGHAHTYSRTYLLKSFEQHTIASTSDRLTLSQGRSFAVVAGLGGRSAHSQRRRDPWFAAAYAPLKGDPYGALFCAFNAGGDPTKAECYFKDTAGQVRDRFTIVRPHRE